MEANPNAIKFKVRCWNCGFEHDMIVGLDKEKPAPRNGDVTFCTNCGSFAMFDDTFPDAVRKPNPSENFEIKHSKTLQKVYMCWAIVYKNGGIDD